MYAWTLSMYNEWQSKSWAASNPTFNPITSKRPTPNPISREERLSVSRFAVLCYGRSIPLLSRTLPFVIGPSKHGCTYLYGEESMSRKGILIRWGWGSESWRFDHASAFLPLFISFNTIPMLSCHVTFCLSVQHFLILNHYNTYTNCWWGQTISCAAIMGHNGKK